MNSSAALPSMMSESPAIVLTNCDSGGTVLAARQTLGDSGGGGAHDGYNLNVNATVSGLLAAESACSTPRTPEILNSLIAMTNPLDQYAFSGSEKSATAGYKSGSYNDSSSSTSGGSPASSPAAGTPPSIQKTCSDLIKAGLKLSIESKRKMSVSECSDAGLGCVKRLKKEEVPSDEDYDSGHTSVSKSDGLTPEDEERRRRRRERNKIAATKCRLKKRERTVNLVTESEVLESQNHDLKSQLQELEVQRRQLLDMLSQHAQSCVKLPAASSSPPAAASYPAPHRPYDSPAGGYGGVAAAYDAASPYIRPESAHVLASSYTCAAPPPPLEASPMDGAYLLPGALDDYHRPDSALALPAGDAAYAADGYLPKAGLLVIEQGEQEYYEEMSYHMSHNYGGDQQKGLCSGQGLNNGCLA